MIISPNISSGRVVTLIDALIERHSTITAAAIRLKCYFANISSTSASFSDKRGMDPRDFKAVLALRRIEYIEVSLANVLF